MTMTDNQIIVTHLTDRPTEQAAPSVPADELVRVSAGDVVIEDNVRTAADLDAAFVASIKQHGVLLPTIGYRNDDGAVVVRDGQMRVLAARVTGHDVPVFVTARDTTDAKRLVEQLVTNERRTALTDADRLAAYRQLSFAGLSVTAIAKQTGTKREQVKNTLTVAKSDAATAAVVERQVSFTVALLVAEFENDPAAAAALNEVIEDGYDDTELTHYATQLRQDQHRRHARTKAHADLVAEGKRVVGADDDYEVLTSLTDAEDDVTAYVERTPLDPETHATCPGVAWAIPEWGEPEPVQVCTTPDTHHPRHLPYRAPSTAPMTAKTDEEQAAEAEERKAARRALVANNKAWDAANEVRRAWLGEFLQRKTMPKDTARFLAVALTRYAHLSDAYGTVRTIGLLGVDSSGYHRDTLAQWVQEHPTKALHVAVAVMLTGFENASNRDWWRHPCAEGRAYLTQLAEWGYPLSRIERTAASIDTDADTNAGTGAGGGDSAEAV